MRDVRSVGIVSLLVCFAACASSGTSDTSSPTRSVPDAGAPDATAASVGSDSGASTIEADSSVQPTADAEGDAGSADDAGDAADGDAPPNPLTASWCFRALEGPVPGPDYDQFHPIIQEQCAGTHQQNITGVQKIVFLGDSITTGTPPTLPTDWYKTRLSVSLGAKFGTTDVSDCSKWGSKTIDLMDPAGYQQIEKCFPDAVETKTTLVIMTIGGNDIDNWASHQMDAPTATAAADTAVGYLRDAVSWASLIRSASRMARTSSSRTSTSTPTLRATCCRVRRRRWQASNRTGPRVRRRSCISRSSS